MEFIFLLIGFLTGFIMFSIIKRKNEIHGNIDIDNVTGLCRFRITSNKLANPHKKYAIFKINHNAEISRDEQLL